MAREREIVNPLDDIVDDAVLTTDPLPQEASLADPLAPAPVEEPTQDPGLPPAPVEPEQPTQREIDLQRQLEELQARSTTERPVAASDDRVYDADAAVVVQDRPGVPGGVLTQERRSHRPIPENQLTDEQRRIRDLEHQLATRTGTSDPAEVFDTAAHGDKVMIHVLVDGFTFADRVWYRGQEVEFVVGGQADRETYGRDGVSWLRYDTATQYTKWGEQRFAHGPWPGRSYEDRKAAEAELARSRRAPVLPLH